MNALMLLSRWFYTGLMMIQIVMLALKLTGYSVLGISLSEWSWFVIFLPAIVYAALKYLYVLGDALSNIYTSLLGIAIIVGFVWFILYMIYF